MTVAGVWAVVGGFLKPLWALLTDKRVLAAIAAALCLWTAYGLGGHVTRLEIEAAQKDKVIAAQNDAITGLNTNIKAAQDNAAQLAKATGALTVAAGQARKDLMNVLPKPEDDHGCDLPGAATRGMLNRSSGYPE